MKTYENTRSGEVVEAIQIDDWTFAAAPANAGHLPGCKYDSTHRLVRLPVQDGGQLGALGDWIVRHKGGSLSVMGERSFNSTFRVMATESAA